MAFAGPSNKWASVGGVATAVLADHMNYTGRRELQCSIVSASGTGSVTFTAKASRSDAFEPVFDSNGDPMTISLSAADGQRTVIICGASLDEIMATSSVSGDSFELLVGQ